MSDFLTVNIASFFNKQKPVEETKPETSSVSTKDTPENTNGVTQEKAGAQIDWAKELEKRLADNKALDSEAQVSEYEIESQFWSEFFKSRWPEDIAEILDKVIGELLKKDIKILGFDSSKNPLLGFLELPYVQTNLVKTKLLNDNTFKAIHNAIAKKKMADKEFFVDSDYNILYCRDLYTKRITAIERYLDIQKEILPPSKSSYSKELQDKNKKVFLNPGQKSVKQTDAKLNDLDQVEKLSGVSSKNSKKVTTDSNDDIEVLGQKQLNSFIDNIESSEQIAAALQYITLTTGNSAAQKLLTNNNELKRIPIGELTKATKYVAKTIGNKIATNKKISLISLTYPFIIDIIKSISGWLNTPTTIINKAKIIIGIYISLLASFFSYFSSPTKKPLKVIGRRYPAVKIAETNNTTGTNQLKNPRLEEIAPLAKYHFDVKPAVKGIPIRPKEAIV
jgi:hypothetical protein